MSPAGRPGGKVRAPLRSDSSVPGGFGLAQIPEIQRIPDKVVAGPA